MRKPIKKRDHVQKHDDFMRETEKLMNNEHYRVTYLKKLKKAEELAKPKPKSKSK